MKCKVSNAPVSSTKCGDKEMLQKNNSKPLNMRNSLVGNSGDTLQRGSDEMQASVSMVHAIIHLSSRMQR